MVNDATLGQFIGAVYAPYMPPIVGAVLALILLITIISLFRMSLPEGKKPS